MAKDQMAGLDNNIHKLHMPWIYELENMENYLNPTISAMSVILKDYIPAIYTVMLSTLLKLAFYSYMK